MLGLGKRKTKQLGKKKGRGLVGAGVTFKNGRNIAVEDQDELRSRLENYELETDSDE
jgi:hypothetical protein